MPINLNNAKEHCCLKDLKWKPLNNPEVDLNACLPVAALGLDGIAVDVISLASLCSIAPKCAVGNRETQSNIWLQCISSQLWDQCNGSPPSHPANALQWGCTQLSQSVNKCTKVGFLMKNWSLFWQINCCLNYRLNCLYANYTDEFLYLLKKIFCWQ